MISPEELNLKNYPLARVLSLPLRGDSLDRLQVLDLRE